MEVTPLMIYAIDISGTVKFVSKMVLLLSLIASIILGVLAVEEEFARRAIKVIVVPVILISTLFTVFIPESKTLASMYVIPAVVNNEQIQNIGKNGLESLELLTKQWVYELREVKSKKDDQTERRMER